MLKASSCPEQNCHKDGSRERKRKKKRSVAMVKKKRKLKQKKETYLASCANGTAEQQNLLATLFKTYCQQVSCISKTLFREACIMILFQEKVREGGSSIRMVNINLNCEDSTDERRETESKRMHIAEAPTTGYLMHSR